MYDLITIGDSTIDTFLLLDDAHLGAGLRKEDELLCLRYADKIPIVKSDQSVGGNATNVAVGTTKLGLKTAIITELGDDLNGQAIKQALEKAGIDTKFVKNLKNSETRYSVVLNYRGERTILSYHTKRNYTFPKIPRTKWIYYTSLSESFEKIQTKLISYIKKNPNTKLAMNPGSYQMKKGMDHLRTILPQLDVLLVNKEEAAKILNKKESVISMCKLFLKKGVRAVVITDGIKGSMGANNHGIIFVPASPIKAIAKTGAGDAYTSGFLSATILGKSLSEAMLWGTTNASSVIQEIGAQKGLLNKTQMEKAIKKLKLKPVKV